MPLPLTTRVLLFLYSTRNIAGCIFALVALGLFFTGIIDRGWLAIVAGAYLAGFLIVPSSTVVEPVDVSAVADDAILDNLDRLLAAAKRALPVEALRLLDEIRSVVAQLLPRFRGGATPALLDQMFNVKQAVSRDLALTVANYTKLPTAFANVHPLQGGQTAKQMLLEQLGLLKGHLSGLLESALRDDADAVVNNGRFLREKFHQIDFVGTGSS